MQIAVKYINNKKNIKVRRISWKQRCEEQLAKTNQMIMDINHTLKELGEI